MRVALVTLQFGAKAYFEASRANLEAYAARHGYSLHVGDGAVPDARARHWGKLTAIKSALAVCDLALYLDADCVIVDPSRSVQSLVPEMRRADLLAARDASWNVNTGVLVLTSGALDIVDAWEWTAVETPRFATTWPLDELAFNEIVLERYFDRIEIPRLIRGETLDFHSGRGPFIRHFPNGDEHAKLARMTRALAQG